MFRSIITGLVLAGLLTAPTYAHQFCATNSTELQNALDAAEINGEDDEIRIATGMYPVPFGGFAYDSVAHDNGDDKSLSLKGGYTGFAGNPCGQILNFVPWETILDGNNAYRGLSATSKPHGDISVKFLTFVAGNASSAPVPRGGGLYVNILGDYSGDIEIEQNAFVGNEARIGGAIFADNNASNIGRMHVTNNLFVANWSYGAGAAVLALNDGRIYFISNTVLNNHSTENIWPGGVYIGSVSTGLTSVLVANNNLWGNDHADLSFSGGAVTTVYNNNIGVLWGTPDNQAGNISVEPEYQDGDLFEYTPVRNSPLVDAGAMPPPIPLYWNLTNHDLNDAARVVGNFVDIGAYENERIFADGFE